MGSCRGKKKKKKKGRDKGLLNIKILGEIIGIERLK
jgi:hypothetical protein